MAAGDERAGRPSAPRPHDLRQPPTVLERVIVRARRGDQESFDAIYRTYQPHLLRHLRLTCGDRADDVSAATWASVATSIKNFEGDGHDFRKWLFTIARRRLVDDLRRSARDPIVVADPEHLDRSVDFSSPLESVEWIEGALSTLPVRQAEVVSLRIVGGLSVADVAELLGISPENVRVLSHRGLTALRASFVESSQRFSARTEEISKRL